MIKAVIKGFKNNGNSPVFDMSYHYVVIDVVEEKDGVETVLQKNLVYGVRRGVGTGGIRKELRKYVQELNQIKTEEAKPNMKPKKADLDDMVDEELEEAQTPADEEKPGTKKPKPEKDK
jgi:hypothetical protein